MPVSKRRKKKPATEKNKSSPSRSTRIPKFTEDETWKAGSIVGIFAIKRYITRGKSKNEEKFPRSH